MHNAVAAHVADERAIYATAEITEAVLAQHNLEPAMARRCVGTWNAEGEAEVDHESPPVSRLATESTIASTPPLASCFASTAAPSIGDCC